LLSGKSAKHYRKEGQGNMTNIGIKLSLDTGSFISNAAAARSAISDLDSEIKQAEKDGDKARVGQLYYAKQQMTTTAEGFERDTKSLVTNPVYQQIMNKQMSGPALTKSEEQFISRLDASAEATKKLTAAILDAIKTGDTESIFKQASDLSTQAQDFHKLATGTDDKNAGKESTKDAIKAIGINQILNAFNDGFARWASSLDRSGIINQYGSGDILGGRIAEQRRQADFWGGIAQAGLGVTGAVVGSIIGVGTMAGAAVGAGVGKAIDTGLHVGPNREATEAAYAGLWQNRSGQSMELAAITGSANDVRGAFKSAADAAAEFGYSAEEGMDAMKAAAQQGLSGMEAKEAARQVFDYERRTGADRGTLLGVSTMSARYGLGDSLRTGWAGLGASGMASGQYNEYLRAMQRVMEDGISKGFIRSSDQVVQSLTMLSQITGNDPLWQGENGARRLMEMNTGLENATGLSSVSDIVAFRAAQQISGSESYVDSMKILEQGITGEHGHELFKNYMNITSQAEGYGRDAIVERMRQTFGFNYTNADTMYNAWDKNKNITKDDWKQLIDSFKQEPSPADSPELDAAKIIEKIKNIYTDSGMIRWESTIKTLQEELTKAIQELGGIKGPIDTTGMTPIEAATTRQDEYRDALISGDKDRIYKAGIELELATSKALAPQTFIDPLDEELRRKVEIDQMLKKSGMPWEKGRATLFTEDVNPFTKNDDERAFDRLDAYGKQPSGSSARQAYDEFIEVVKLLTSEQMIRLNESNDINKMIPDVMTDKTAQLLTQTIEKLRKEMEDVNITYDEEVK
jgi:hypothetical protein